MSISASLNLLAIVASLTGPNWRFQKLADAISDRTGAALEVKSVDQKAKLVFACDLTDPDRPIAIQFLAPSYLGGEYNDFVIRADKRPPFPGSWSITASTGYTFDPDIVKPLVAEVSTAERVYVRAFDYEGQPVDALFVDMPSRQLFQAVADACGQPNFFG